MKALVYEAPEQIRHSDIPEPAQTEGETLVRIMASGIGLRNLN